jgi:adenylate cyclase
MYDRATLSERTGLDPAVIDEMIETGAVSASAGSRFTEGDLRRVIVVRELEQSGLPLAALGAALQAHQLSLAFVDEPGFARVAALSTKTFEDVAHETGMSLGLVMSIREAIGFAPPTPNDRVRSDELAIVAMLEVIVGAGVPEQEAERAIRTYGDSARRMAETESFWFQEFILGPPLRAGKSWDEVNAEVGASMRRLEEVGDAALLAVIHAQQAHNWIQSIFDRFESTLAQEGAVGAGGAQPTICFLDLTGYTRLTEQHGDAAAADVAGNLARLVQRSAVNHGGRAIKWLGDGVMFHFRTPGPAVVAALEMVQSSSDAGLPPAHVGVHCGPVLFQEGDYFGMTVNAASRIADYARPGEVLVTRAVADATDANAVKFTEIGSVQLKGMSEDLDLLSASRSTGGAGA